MSIALMSALFLLQDEPQVPWRTDVEKARQAAMLVGKPCVIILHVDSSAL